VEGSSREQRAPRSPEAEVKEYRRRFLLALVLSLPVWLCMIPPVVQAVGLSHHAMAYVLFVFTTPVMFYSGASFFAGAASAARHRSTNMDTLVALGTSAAYFYSAWVTFSRTTVAAAGHEPAVHDTAVMIITFILLGRWLKPHPGPGLEGCAASSPWPRPPPGCAGARPSRKCPWRKSRWATWWWCGPGRRSPWTGSWPKA
jgi:cation transport ATPase